MTIGSKKKMIYLYYICSYMADYNLVSRERNAENNICFFKGP